MTDFVYGNDPATHATDKVNDRPLGPDPTRQVTSTEWNSLANSVLDLRDAIIQSEYLNFVSNPSATVSAAGNVKIRNNAGKLEVSENAGAYLGPTDVIPTCQSANFVSNPSATVSAANEVKIRNNAGKLQLSENGGAYKGFGPLNVIQLSDWGVVGDGVTDNLSIFNAAIASVGSSVAVLVVPPGTYYFSNTLTINKHIILTGHVPQRPGSVSTTLKFNKDIEGLVVAPAGANSVIANLTLEGTLAGTATDVLLSLQCRAIVHDCYLKGPIDQGFLYINGTGSYDCNGFVLSDLYIGDGGATLGGGLSIEGVAGRGLITNVVVAGTSGTGPIAFADDSTTTSGNTYVNCTATTSTGMHQAFNITNANNCVLLNCHQSGTFTSASVVTAPSVILGGTVNAASYSMGGKLTVNATSSSHNGDFFPSADNTHELGNGTYRWEKAHVGTKYTWGADDSLKGIYDDIINNISYVVSNDTDPLALVGRDATGDVVRVGSPDLRPTAPATQNLLSAQWDMDGTADTVFAVGGDGTLSFESTDISGSPGNGTAHSTMGLASIASGANSVTVTNNKCTATSQVFITWYQDSGRAPWWVTVSGGSFTVNIDGNAVADAKFGWLIVNPLTV